MGSCTITLKGKGVYKIGSEVVSLSTTSKTVTNSANEESFNYDTDFSIKRVSPVKLFNDEDSDMPIPIYARNNDEIKDEIADFPNAIFDIYTFKCEAQAFKGNKNIRFATICSYDNSYGDSASEMFANSKLKYARFLDVGTEYCYVSSAYKMFSNCELLEDVIGIKNLHNQEADYIFNKDHKLAKKFGEEDVVQAIKDLGYYNDWYDGLNRTFFWDCPYNGTLPEFITAMITDKDSYDWQYNEGGSFNPNTLIPNALNHIPLDEKLDTYNYTMNKDSSIKTDLGFYSYDDRLLRLHFDNTDFKRYYKTELFLGETDPEISIDDNYDDKVKGIQNLLYNIKDLWDFAGFKNTAVNTLELDTSVVLNMDHNGPKLNDIISPIWAPEDGFRLNIMAIDVSTTVPEPVDIIEHYMGTKTGPDYRLVDEYVWEQVPKGGHGEFWKDTQFLGRITHLNGTVEDYYGERQIYDTVNVKTGFHYNYAWQQSGQGQPFKWTYLSQTDDYGNVYQPRRFDWVKPAQGNAYRQPNNYSYSYEAYYEGNENDFNNPVKAGQKLAYEWAQTYKGKKIEEFTNTIPWEYTRTKTIQVPKNVYLSKDADFPAQDISGVFKDVEYIKSINFNVNKVSKADELFMNCKNIESAIGSITNQGRIKVESAKHIFDGAFITNPHIDFVVDTLDAESAFENSGVVDPTFFTSWTSVLNGNKLFKNSKVESLKTAVFPEGIQTIAEAFADCENLVDVEGNWLQPNSSMHYQNYTYHKDTNSWTKDWVNPTSKDGYFYFPDSVQDIHSLFKDSGLQSVKELALLRYGNNDNVFDGCHNLTEINNLYLNENPNYGNIFYDTPNQNKDWRIWFPTNIKSSYWNAADIGLDPYKVPNLYCDDGFIVVDNESPDSQVQRRVAYEAILNPERKFKFNYFSHIHPHTVDNNRWYHEIHDVDVWYK